MLKILKNLSTLLFSLRRLNVLIIITTIYITKSIFSKLSKFSKESSIIQLENNYYFIKINLHLINNKLYNISFKIKFKLNNSKIIKKMY